jgi:aspartyl-tRNA(Asn)/glutamyl-tRNA(Gln) amidotransferase subunit C
MSLITKEEVLKIAKMSHIELSEQEIIKMQSHVEAVLAYAARVQDLSAIVLTKKGLAQDVDIIMKKNVNVERDDVAIACQPESILAQAPEREGNYFVVPVIIETNSSQGTP